MISRIKICAEPIASPAARELIASLDAELLALYPEDETDQHFHLYAEEVTGGQGVFLVAYVSGEVVSCGAFRMLDTTTAEVRRMYVRPPMRGLGIGRALLEALEARGRALGAVALVLETGPRQPAATALYTSMGSTRIAPFGSHVVDPLSTFMGKQL